MCTIQAEVWGVDADGKRLPTLLRSQPKKVAVRYRVPLQEHAMFKLGLGLLALCHLFLEMDYFVFAQETANNLF